MKYSVTVGSTTVMVEVRGDKVVVDGKEHHASLTHVPHTPVHHLSIDGRSHAVALIRGGEGWTVGLNGESLTAEVVDERTKALREMTGKGGKQAAGGVVKAPMPGLVLRLEVAVGDSVGPGQGLVVLEAMKMENEIKSTVAGVVTAIRATPGQAVEKGALLIELGPAA